MAYTITPYKRDGIGNISTSGSSTTVTCATAQGFRNVAVGAIINVAAVTRTVVTKTSETVVVVNTAVDWSTPVTWEYTNPVLTLTGYNYIKHSKNDKPTVTPIIHRDANIAFVTPATGVVRDIQLSGWIQSTTIDDLYKNATILESLTDGSQCYQGTCVYAEDTPPRTMYVYVTSQSWQIINDKPNWLNVMINMVECKNRGST